MMRITLTKICKFWFMAIIQNLNDADYLDEDLQVLVYGDHLICYRTFDIAYLPECSKIGAFMKVHVFVFPVFVR